MAWIDIIIKPLRLNIRILIPHFASSRAEHVPTFSVVKTGSYDIQLVCGRMVERGMETMVKLSQVRLRKLLQILRTRRPL